MYQRLASNSRFWVLTGGFVVSLLIFGLVQQYVPGGQLQSIRLEQTYGFASLFFLYVAMLISPFYSAFVHVPGKTALKHARRAIGVLSFYFASLHLYIALFKQLGGFGGIGFLDRRYLVSLILGALASLVLLVLAATSLDIVVQKFGFKRWKLLHRLVYAAGILILIHVVIIGTHFTGGSRTLARVVFGAVLLLFFLEAWRADTYIKGRFKRLSTFGLATMLVMHILFLGVGFLLGKSGSSQAGLSGHSHTLVPGVDVTDYNAPDEAGERTGYKVSLGQKTYGLIKLAEGAEQLVFSFSPALADSSGAQCFLINQQNFNYIHGFIKSGGTPEAPTILCAPLGDIEPPAPGTYLAYLRYTGKAGLATARFTVVIQ